MTIDRFCSLAFESLHSCRISPCGNGAGCLRGVKINHMNNHITNTYIICATSPNRIPSESSSTESTQCRFEKETIYKNRITSCAKRNRTGTHPLE